MLFIHLLLRWQNGFKKFKIQTVKTQPWIQERKPTSKRANDLVFPLLANDSWCVMLAWPFDSSGLSCTAWLASQLGVIPGETKPLWSRTSSVWSPDPRHSIVTHELPCCSLTHRRYFFRETMDRKTAPLYFLWDFHNKTVWPWLMTNVCFLKRHLYLALCVK